MSQSSDSPPTDHVVRRLGSYISSRKGWYRVQRTGDVMHWRALIHSFSRHHLSCPATVRERPNGTEAIYGSASWKAGQRPLLLVRLPDDENKSFYENPYDDPYLDSIISLPVSKAQMGYLFRCAACARTEFFEGASRQAFPLARDAGWHNTNARGWVCTDHYYQDWRGKRSQATKKRLADQKEHDNGQSDV